MSEDDRNGRRNPPQPPFEDDDISIEFLDDEGRPFGTGPSRDDSGPAGSAGSSDEPGPSESEIPELRERVQELEDRYLRQRADFENYRKRVNRDREEYRRAASAEVVSRMLPVLDNLNRALKVLENEAPQEWCQGLELVQQQFADALGSLGMEEIDAQGKPFDPTLHEAVMMVPRPDLPAGTVTEVFEKGYTLGGKVVKPARVVVSGSGTDEQHRQGETDA